MTIDTSGLSARAQKLFARVQRGEYYPAYEDEPKAMEELMQAGLVTMAGRIISIKLCYVPAQGYTGYEPEKFDRTINPRGDE